MGIHGWITLGVVVGTVAALWRSRLPPSLIVLGAVVLLLFLGVIAPEEAFSGFSNPAPITVAALFVLAHAVEKTGALQGLIARTLEGGNGPRGSLARVLLPTAGASAFLNNTPIVAMLIPQVRAWAEKKNVPVSTFLIPISFAAILGGTLTLVGTSTNLVVSGLLTQSGHEPIGMFELTGLSLPAVLAGALLLIVLGPTLLPNRDAPPAPSQDLASLLPHGGRRGPLTLGLTGAVVFLAALGWVPILNGSLFAVGLLVATGTLTAGEVRRAVHLDVIVLIAAAFGLGAAIEETGLAEALVHGVLEVTGEMGSIAILATVVVATFLLTEIITNNAAAVLMFPIAISSASAAGVDPRAFAVAVALTASASFLTPIGYQTNTMVYGAGGYRFTDFTRLGGVLSLVFLPALLLMVSLRWGLR